MSEENDPLTALSAAAKSPAPTRRGVPKRSPAVSPAPQYAARPGMARPGTRSAPLKLSLLPVIAIAAITFLLGLGIGIGVTMAFRKSSANADSSDAVQSSSPSRAPASGGPGDLFPKVKSQDPTP